MSGTAHIYTAISSLISILFLWVMAFWLYRDYRIDLFRQRMFRVRDELFDLAASGQIPFDHPAYGLLRSTLNGFIRFGHRLTPLHVALILLLILKHRGPRPVREESLQDRLDELSSDLEPEVRETLRDSVQRVHVLVVKHVVLSSPLFVLSIVPPLLTLILWRLVLRGWASNTSNFLRRIDAATTAIGTAA